MVLLVAAPRGRGRGRGTGDWEKVWARGAEPVPGRAAGPPPPPPPPPAPRLPGVWVSQRSASRSPSSGRSGSLRVSGAGLRVPQEQADARRTEAGPGAPLRLREPAL